MRFGPYTVDDPPDREGGQAFVYFTTDPSTGAAVAIKVARPSKWSHKRMRQEIEAQSALAHPNILPILENDPNKRWHATSRAEQSLEDHGPFARLDWTRLRVGMMGVASAVRHAHTKGYVHRDLSPGNVLVFPWGWVVSDWGFVHIPPSGGVVRLTQPLERFGTPDFVAPEVLTDPTNVTPQADVYSIGRLAVWGTGIQRGADIASQDAAARWWSRFIDGCTPMEPTHRWTMEDVEAHLRMAPRLTAVPGLASASAPRSRTRVAGAGNVPYIGGTGDRCPQCGSHAGSDASERCLVCRASMAY